VIVAIASGKGGTGKTTVAASLVYVWKRPVMAVDLDVEAPNLHLFLRPEIGGGKTARLEVPEVDGSLCTGCGACADICQFKAVTLLGDFPLVFPEMCHGCGGCMAVCGTGALRPGFRDLGDVTWGTAGNAMFLMGRLRIGEAMSPPLMRVVRTHLALETARREIDVIIDAPPGTSCPAMSAVADADAIVLVTEPTPFGLHDLRLAREAFSRLNKPMGVVVNRAGSGDEKVGDYCRTTGLPILAEIPYQRRSAEAYSRGEIIAQTVPGQFDQFVDLAESVENLVPVLEACHA
jgi:MinD superfamily P-loop ATPase